MRLARGLLLAKGLFFRKYFSKLFFSPFFQEIETLMLNIQRLADILLCTDYIASSKLFKYMKKER